MQFDTPSVKQRFDGDKRFFLELCGIFFEQYGPRAEEMKSALHEGQLEKVRAAAHYVKGALLNLGAESASIQAAALEHASRENRAEELPKFIEALEREIESFKVLVAKIESGDIWEKA
ncbi:MAG: Hpt domain-containing protein [Deltaproteobacteria bacterium]|nr:Hpt domain-containing protein [Deltaproteobacteria bacterium]